MNDFIINESNVKDICAEIIAGLMNMRVLPHDVPGETFDKWTSIVEKQIRYEAQYLQDQKELVPKCEICGGTMMEHFYHPPEEDNDSNAALTTS